MENFRRQFIAETAENLQKLRQKLQNADSLSDLLKRESYRALHTVKGTAQTFGFDAASCLAHDLESLLAADTGSRELLIEGLALLRESLFEKKTQPLETFKEKFRAAVPQFESTIDSDNEKSPIPQEFYSQLSNREKMISAAAVRDGKNLVVLQIDFAVSSFAADLINFQEQLNSAGEIIAAFPGAETLGEGNIGFRFLAASAASIESLTNNNAAKIVWKFSPPSAINEVLQQIILHGGEIAARFGKKIEFETQIAGTQYTSAELKVIFEVLLHIVRNAVDHAIERTGKIVIRAAKTERELLLTIADDGRGIDLEKIKARAIEKKIIFAADILSEKEVLDLIFQPEFSTKKESNEISGRGIGLDAVKSRLENSGGTLRVSTEKGKGTAFEIRLPLEKETK